MSTTKINIEKYKKALPGMRSEQIRGLIKDIYDERKHNRTLPESELKKLKDLEKEAEKVLKERKVINEKTEADYQAWKRKMEKERRCY